MFNGQEYYIQTEGLVTRAGSVRMITALQWVRLEYIYGLDGSLEGRDVIDTSSIRHGVHVLITWVLVNGHIMSVLWGCCASSAQRINNQARAS